MEKNEYYFVHPAKKINITKACLPIYEMVSNEYRHAVLSEKGLKVFEDTLSKSLRSVGFELETAEGTDGFVWTVRGGASKYGVFYFIISKVAKIYK